MSTITIIKGPHHPDDAKFWEPMKQEFEAAHPDIALNPTFFKWQTMDAELTAGYASQPADVVYLVDLVLAKFVNAGQVADITEWVDSPDYADGKGRHRALHLGRDQFQRQAVRRRRSRRGLRHLLQPRSLPEGRHHRVPADARRARRGGQETHDARRRLGLPVPRRVPDYAHWDWLPYVHNDDADVMTPDLTAQNLDPRPRRQPPSTWPT